MMSGVQRSAKISAPRAMGQYWPYVLTAAMLRTPASGWKYRFYTFSALLRSGPMESSREEDTMTTRMTAEIGSGRKHPAVVEIEGFRGRLITADQPDYDIARAVWNGAINRRPRSIARC